jgi:CheY-like chemotaxis protein
MLDVRVMSKQSLERRVLVVDDDEAERTALASVLREVGFEVALAEDGEQALLALEHRAPPALVLLDLMMPGVNGWQVLEAMERNAGLADIPVIVLTAFAARGGLPAGCRVLHKPFDREVLVAEALALTRMPAADMTSEDLTVRLPPSTRARARHRRRASHRP